MFESTRKQAPGGVVLLLPLLAAVALGLLGLRCFSGVVEALSALSRSRQSGAWPTADGVITEATVQLHTRQSGLRHVRETTTKRLEVVYEYRVAGETLTGDRITFGFSTPVPLSQYHRGDSVRVYYDPEKPSESVLEPNRWDGAGGATLLALLGSLFLGLAVFLFRMTMSFSPSG